MTNQINPFVRISPHWTKESTFKRTINEKPLRTNERRRYGHWRGYQISSLRLPKDVTRGYASHPWMPPTGRRESRIYTQCQIFREVTHSYLHLPLPLLCFYLTLPSETQWPAPLRWPLKYSFFFFGHVQGLWQAWATFCLDDQFDWQFWHRLWITTSNPSLKT